MHLNKLIYKIYIIKMNALLFPKEDIIDWFLNIAQWVVFKKCN